MSKKSLFRLLCLPIFFLTLSFSAFAQNWELGFGGGIMNYTGDVSPRYDFSNARPTGEIFFRYNPNPIFAIRAGFMLGNMVADESDSEYTFQQRRGVRFSNTVYEASLRAEYNFRDYRAMSELKKLSPYVFLGGAVSHINVNTNYQDNTTKAIELSLPVGVGLKWMMAYSYNFGVELGMRPTFTDALDGLTQDGSNSEISPVGKFEMTNLFNNDRYYYAGISISYTFNRVVCPLEFQ